ncbi:hypothetical protein T10_4850 [Trichinella papuae]|uniref:Uncharacterized protein n=1 Tax=Trichinella papuae TaxID=268474 RepID=A0A0V1M0R8_9BILA|nr:hypothetical protein T10_7743 [Trichinella papuae]KRZ65412.1 hypothetical protein T10_8933 [Trichinella papuae]KRZ66227.1 hypothetical protein T10_4850 [Trichinella papuae]
MEIHFKNKWAVNCIIASAVACVAQVTRVQIPLPSEKYNTRHTLDRSTQNELTCLICLGGSSNASASRVSVEGQY